MMTCRLSYAGSRVTGKDYRQAGSGRNPWPKLRSRVTPGHGVQDQA
ncbi:hypothetical protein [Komagataeibacter kakiaceti]|nr:hypothetical protein [Komagataeibacter kakiaceti]